MAVRAHLIVCFLLVQVASLSAAFRSEILAQLDETISEAVAANKCPGAVLWLEHEGEIYRHAYGSRALNPVREKMTEDTMFDVASLTKVVATTPAVMLLIERGQLRLEARVNEYLPASKEKPSGAITLRQLLTHTSGLVSGISGAPFDNYDEAIAQAIDERPRVKPGTEFHYCDVNFILLAEIVKRVSHRPIDQFVADEIFKPLGMRDTRYLPAADQRPRIAPTGHSGEVRTRGRVHDPTVRRMGGVSGQAGVFTTASDLARFARMILNGGELEGVRILQPETVQLMTSVQTSKNVSARRGLGWDIDSPYSRPRGLVFPLGSYGHTGFTGSMLWIDPFSKTFVIFLSNRVHASGSGDVLDLYAIVGTLAARAVQGFDFRQVAGELPYRTNFIRWGIVTNYLGLEKASR